jgi:hypothetical protein
MAIIHFTFLGPPKFTQIGIFGLKINHLATLFKRHKENASKITPDTPHLSTCMQQRRVLRAG